MVVHVLLAQALVHLSPLPGGGIGTADVDVPAAVTQLEQQQQDQKLDFLGPVLPPEVAKGIAEGMTFWDCPVCTRCASSIHACSPQYSRRTGHCSHACPGPQGVLMKYAWARQSRL